MSELLGWNFDNSILKKSSPPESSSGIRARLQIDLVAQAFESAHEVLLDHLPIVLIEVVATQVLIRPAVTQQVLDDDQDTMTDCNGSALGSASCGDATILRGQIGVLAMSGGVGGLDQEPTGVGIAGCRVLPLKRLPALSWLPGQMPTQEARCLAEGNWLISTPVSAKRP